MAAKTRFDSQKKKKETPLITVGSSLDYPRREHAS